MPSFSTQVVTAVLAEREGLQRVALDSGRRAYVLTQLIGAVAVGDPVVVNTTAVDLGLGTGGWDVVHWNLARSELSVAGAGHVMKLRYTSLQCDTGVAEEYEGYAAPDSLGGVPVVACGLHSQVGVVAAVLKHLAPALRLAYVMTDSAALPLALSDLVAELRGKGLVDLTVSAGQAFGGDFEAVNVRSALDVAVWAGAEVVVVGPGPGNVGTGTERGHGAMEVASVVDAASAGGGRPVVALRASSADPRRRHRGVSHHSTTALEQAHASALVPVPRGSAPLDVAVHTVLEVDLPDVPALLDSHGLRVTSMGRTVAEDPDFFAYAAAAGVAAATMGIQSGGSVVGS
ncbi:MAG TPA: DUF3866 family protein [Acidimicrobiales bacterium]|nr:DUF3866 family protein [Acidimicrobiales bacterium]